MIREGRSWFGIKALCAALGLARASYYRSQKLSVSRRTKGNHPRALAVEERREVTSLLNEERFCDQAPAEIYATLLDEGKYFCSERTMYRILAEKGQAPHHIGCIPHPHS